MSVLAIHLPGFFVLPWRTKSQAEVWFVLPLPQSSAFANTNGHNSFPRDDTSCLKAKPKQNKNQHPKCLSLKWCFLFFFVKEKGTESEGETDCMIPHMTWSRVCSEQEERYSTPSTSTSKCQECPGREKPAWCNLTHMNGWRYLQSPNHRIRPQAVVITCGSADVSGHWARPHSAGSQSVPFLGSVIRVKPFSSVSVLQLVNFLH